MLSYISLTYQKNAIYICIGSDRVDAGIRGRKCGNRQAKYTCYLGR